eukprot:2758817-Rhodomonas_salina.1
MTLYPHYAFAIVEIIIEIIMAQTLSVVVAIACSRCGADAASAPSVPAQAAAAEPAIRKN